MARCEGAPDGERRHRREVVYKGPQNLQVTEAFVLKSAA